MKILGGSRQRYYFFPPKCSLLLAKHLPIYAILHRDSASLTVQIWPLLNGTQQLMGYHCNTDHLLDIYCVYHAVLSATRIILIPTTNLIGQHHYCSHFPDKLVQMRHIHVLGQAARKKWSWDENPCTWNSRALSHVALSKGFDSGHSSHHQTQV